MTKDQRPPLAFEYHARNRLLGSMAQRERHILRIQASCEFCSLAVKLDGRAASWLSNNFDIPPADAAAPSRAQGLHRRFLCRKTGRVSLHAIGLRLAVLDFTFSENSTQKSFAKALD